MRNVNTPNSTNLYGGVVGDGGFILRTCKCGTEQAFDIRSRTYVRQCVLCLHLFIVHPDGGREQVVHVDPA